MSARKAGVGAEALDGEGVERGPLRVDRLQPRRGVGDELGDHRVVEDRDLRALHDAVVDPGGDAVHGAGLRGPVGRQAARRGQEASARVLGVDAGLDGPAVERDVVLREAEPLALRDADHVAHQVAAGDELRHRVLDLKAGVHLQEIEALVRIDDEFDRAGGGVADGLGKLHRLASHRAARRLVEEGGGRLLHDLLVAPLHRALALAEVDAIPVRVGQHLDLDMARAGDEPLDEHPVVAEGGGGLGRRARKTFRDLVGAVRDAHALAAAAGRGLDHDGIADLVGDADRLLRVRDEAHMAGHGGDAGLRREPLRCDLVAHRGDGVGGRADEDDARLRAGARKTLALGEEAVARMDRAGARPGAGLQDRVLAQIALRRRRRPDPHRLVGHADMRRLRVGVGVNGDGAQAHGASRCVSRGRRSRRDWRRGLCRTRPRLFRRFGRGDGAGCPAAFEDAVDAQVLV